MKLCAIGGTAHNSAVDACMQALGASERFASMDSMLSLVEAEIAEAC